MISNVILRDTVLPDDHDDAVEYIVWVLDVSEQAKSQQHETHLQDEHAGEHDVTDLQNISQLLGLGEGGEGGGMVKRRKKDKKKANVSKIESKQDSKEARRQKSKRKKERKSDQAKRERKERTS